MMKAHVSPGWEFLFIHKGSKTTYSPKFDKKHDKELCLFSPLQFLFRRAHNWQPLPPNPSWGHVPRVVLTVLKNMDQSRTGTLPQPPPPLLRLLSSTQTLPPGGEAHFPHMLLILSNK